MNIEYFISKRIALKASRTFSRLIVRIAIAGIMLSLAVMMLSVAIIKGFKTEIQDKVRGFMGDIQVYRYDLNGSFEKAPFIPGETTLSYLKRHPGIASFYPFATKSAIMIANDEVEGTTFKGVDSTYDWTFIRKHLVSGRLPHFSGQGDNELLISDYTAKRLQLKTGDRLLLHFVQNPPKPRKFTIAGIFDVGIEQIDKSFVIGDLQMIRSLNKWEPEQTGGLEVRVKDFSKLDNVAAEVYDNLDIQLRSRSIRESSPEIFTWLSLLDVNTQVILGLMMIVGVINMITALLIMILERTEMIGILKALGATNSRIIKIFLYNALYLVGLGLLLGNIVGLGLAYLQNKTHFLKLDQTNYYLSHVPVEVHWLDICWLNLATLAICTLVLIIPSLLVSRISPVRAIRFK